MTGDIKGSLSDRALRVALYGVVPDDDPHIIADLIAEIDRLAALQSVPEPGQDITRRAHPCPFCGEPPRLWIFVGGMSLGCSNSRCFGPSTPIFGNPDDLLTAWNTRAALQSVPDGPEELEAWIELNFGGWGVAIREKDDPPIPGEPFMSMQEAKGLTRQAVAKFTAPPPDGSQCTHAWGEVTDMPTAAKVGGES